MAAMATYWVAFLDEVSRGIITQDGRRLYLATTSPHDLLQAFYFYLEGQGKLKEG